MSAQVSLAVVLLVGAGLLSTSLARLRQVEPGMEVEGLSFMPITVPVSYESPEEQLAFFVDLVRNIEAVPGVSSASWTLHPPLYWGNINAEVRTEETLDLEEGELPLFGYHPVGPDYLSTMGIPVLRGREITGSDDAEETPVAVVDELVAERLWPSQDPLGKRIKFGGDWHTVVGVAGRVHQSTLTGDPAPGIYVSSAQHVFFPSPTAVAIRSRIPLRELAPALRAAVWHVNRTIPIPSISAVEDQIAARLKNPRFLAVLSSSFSLSALVLTLAAIFGLMSYWVTARTREVGLRMALGARAAQVLWAVQAQCLRMVLLGLGIGLVLAAGASRLLSAFLFQVSPLDPSTFALVAGGLGLAALLASLVPALRATRVEPTRALRWE